MPRSYNELATLMSVTGGWWVWHVLFVEGGRAESLTRGALLVGPLGWVEGGVMRGGPGQQGGQAG